MIALFLDIVVVSLIFLFFASYHRLFSRRTNKGLIQTQKSWGTVIATTFNKTTNKVNNNNNFNNKMPSTAKENLIEQQKVTKMNPDTQSKQQILFEDPEFPAIWQSIYCEERESDLPSPKGIIWKRPWEINSNACFIRNQTDNSAFQLKDIVQGQLRDCWLAAALLALIQSEEHFNAVIDPTLNNKLNSENYTGKFAFNFTIKETTREVIVDDLLPTKNGQLLFMHSSDGLSFWAALLEKAFAKLYGSYAALENTNHFYRALRLLTGPGTIRLYMLRDITRSQLIRLFSTRITDIRLCRFCCTVTNGFIEKKGHTGRGVLAMRSFTILDFIEDRRRNNYLIKIRNPWSRTTTTQTNTSKSTEKNSPKWEYVSPRFRGIIQKIENGSFLLGIDSFHSFFDYIEWWQKEEDEVEEENKKKKEEKLIQQQPPPPYETTTLLKVEV
uniref:Calpain catalytic domain-containing protein n=3 Tax=Meloidogyne TaxID=189290 RepID=A0A6V7Y8S2_MELEN|nr:unnamed protein product [Meloidogyne enterolobii]